MTRVDPKPTGAPPREVDGVTFRCYRVGIGMYEWRSDDNRYRAGARYRHSTFYAGFAGNHLKTKFRSLENAMKAAVDAGKKTP